MPITPHNLHIETNTIISALSKQFEESGINSAGEKETEQAYQSEKPHSAIPEMVKKTRPKPKKSISFEIDPQVGFRGEVLRSLREAQIELTQRVNSVRKTKKHPKKVSISIESPVDEELPSIYNSLIKFNENFITEKFEAVVCSALAQESEDEEDAVMSYREYFQNHKHENFIFPDGPIVFSIRREGGSGTSLKNIDDINWKGGFRVIARKPGFEDERFLISYSAIQKRKLSKPSYKDAIAYLYPDIDVTLLKRVEGCEDLLMKMDELQKSSNFKFGLLLVKKDQTENEIFANQSTPELEDFYSVLGFKVSLFKFPGFNGGLDTKNNGTGEKAIYQKIDSYEVIYHVGPLLPYIPDDEQQIQRKRHIGNDIVCIVYLEQGAKFDPSLFKSQFLHVYIVVTKEEDGYLVNVVRDRQVPNFPPYIKNPPIYSKKELEEFIVKKGINAERASYIAPRLAGPLGRARKVLMESLLDISKVPRKSEFTSTQNIRSKKKTFMSTPNIRHK